ncbi:MAG TPA: hypothetical protein PLB21_14970, partial [Actinomycetota bacterium]|nr:hypothetical protein [Actinomycetota bacterium]
MLTQLRSAGPFLGGCRETFGGQGSGQGVGPGWRRTGSVHHSPVTLFQTCGPLEREIPDRIITGPGGEKTQRIQRHVCISGIERIATNRGERIVPRRPPSPARAVRAERSLGAAGDDSAVHQRIQMPAHGRGRQV